MTVELNIKLETIKELEGIYKKWIVDNTLPQPKQLLIKNVKYKFLSPVELQRFIQGAKFIVESK